MPTKPQTKERLYKDGAKLVKKFCETNDLPTPSLINMNTDHPFYCLKACGFYRADKIYVAPRKCAHIGRGGASWSYPGYVIDRTPYGVLAHELGHHFDYLSGTKRGRYFSDYSLNLMKRIPEPKMTNYCPNPAEWFAENFRVFVTNPHLFSLLRPKLFDHLSSELSVVETRDWPAILKHAPDRTLQQVEKKIAHAQKTLTN